MLPDILTALLAVVAVSLILGVLLALVISFFGKEEDERVRQIRECLPGINCGACGYKGCDDYAVGLVEGKAKPNLCIPGAKDTAEAIGDILGIESVPEPKDVVAFVHCNGTCDAVIHKAIYDGIKTCRAASMIYGGPETCNHGCLGYGDCTAVCPSKTISITDRVATIDTRACIGCGVCISNCPRKIISMIPREIATVVHCSTKDKGAEARKACKNACIGCKKCEKACTYDAIKVIDNCAIIDYEKCTGCCDCISACPTKCLKRAFSDLAEVARII